MKTILQNTYARALVASFVALGALFLIYSGVVSSQETTPTLPAPTGVSASASSSSSISVSWSLITGVSGINDADIRYSVHYSLGTNRGNVGVPSGTNTATITGLDPNTEYTIAVQASTSTLRSPNSTEVKATTYAEIPFLFGFKTPTIRGSFSNHDYHTQYNIYTTSSHRNLNDYRMGEQMEIAQKGRKW